MYLWFSYSSSQILVTIIIFIHKYCFCCRCCYWSSLFFAESIDADIMPRLLRAALATSFPDIIYATASACCMHLPNLLLTPQSPRKTQLPQLLHPFRLIPRYHPLYRRSDQIYHICSRNLGNCQGAVALPSIASVSDSITHFLLFG